MKTTCPSIVLSALVALGCSGCSVPSGGSMHKEGERVVAARAFYARPITGHAIAWNGLGDAPNQGISLQNYWFMNDRFAVGLGADLIHYKPAGENVIAGELTGRMRYFYGEVDNFGFFMDAGGGFQRAEHNAPPGGTKSNFTFYFGPGVEYRLDDSKSLLLGAEFHHMSNALGRQSSRNPSMNELLMWVGFSIDW